MCDQCSKSCRYLLNALFIIRKYLIKPTERNCLQMGCLSCFQLDESPLLQGQQLLKALGTSQSVNAGNLCKPIRHNFVPLGARYFTLYLKIEL